MAELKVYAWIGRRLEAGGTHHQTREIVAAKSKAEAARLAGVKRPSELWNLSETGNPEQIRLALENPGIILWREINATDGAWKR